MEGTVSQIIWTSGDHKPGGFQAPVVLIWTLILYKVLEWIVKEPIFLQQGIILHMAWNHYHDLDPINCSLQLQLHQRSCMPRKKKAAVQRQSVNILPCLAALGVKLMNLEVKISSEKNCKEFAASA